MAHTMFKVIMSCYMMAYKGFQDTSLEVGG